MRAGGVGQPLNEVVEVGGDPVDHLVHQFRGARIVEEDRAAFPGAYGPSEFEMRRSAARQDKHNGVCG
ncbi:hypothetical protein MPS_1210 [Mycobacterium pseudoshottsii JCM 15466]|nr:hypothetical protein MPS_1210 [Mycobacterium pseudoshottsii JCM 15466]